MDIYSKFDVIVSAVFLPSTLTFLLIVCRVWLGFRSHWDMLSVNKTVSHHL